MSEISRLRWLCRRGMKELDLVMTGYLDNYYLEAKEKDQQAFKALLEMPDPDLFSLLVGRETAADEVIRQLVERLKTMVKQRR